MISELATSYMGAHPVASTSVEKVLGSLVKFLGHQMAKSFSLGVLRNLCVSGA